MSVRAVFFDLDGTLLDTAKDLTGALDKIMQEDGMPALPFEQTRQIVSEGSFALVKLGYQLADGDPEVGPLRQRLLDHYAKHLATDTCTFSGIDALITSLAEHDIAWGIVTNKPWAYAEPLMAEFSFASKPVCILAPEHVSQRKPDPESLYLACKYADCKPEDAIYIGDHRRDIECGINAKMPTIAALYGYIPTGEDTHSWKADHSVNSATELWPIIQQYL